MIFDDRFPGTSLDTTKSAKFRESPRLQAQIGLILPSRQPPAAAAPAAFGNSTSASL